MYAQQHLLSPGCACCHGKTCRSSVLLWETYPFTSFQWRAVFLWDVLVVPISCSFAPPLFSKYELESLSPAALHFSFLLGMPWGRGEWSLKSFMSVPYLKQLCWSPSSQWRGVSPEHLSLCSPGALACAQLRRLAHLGATLVGNVWFFTELLCLQGGQ